MIPISEVLEEAAREADAFDDRFGGDDARHIARAIRALAAKYEGCIVAEGSPVRTPIGPLYRAKEAK